MTQCWSEGELRAYLDHELPAGDMKMVAEHLETCSECGDHWAEIAGRASRVSALLGALPVPERTISIARAPQQAKTATWKWVGAGAALAAGLLLGIVAIPKAPQPVVSTTSAPPVEREPIGPDPAGPIVAAPAVPRMMNAAARPGSRPSTRAAKRPAPLDARSSEDFVSLDDEPISTGVVLRVELGPKGIPADVIFGSDGRPHAIRLVNNKSNH
jgi:anti-sigma factor RsiW